MHRLVTNILVSFVMARALSLQPSTSAISLRKAMALMFGGIMTPDLPPEGLVNRQPQIYFTKLKFSEFHVNNFSSLKFIPGVTIDLLPSWDYRATLGLLDDGTGGFPTQRRNFLSFS